MKKETRQQKKNQTNGKGRIGEVFISHTRLAGRYVLRLCVGQTETRREHVVQAWDCLRGTSVVRNWAPR